MKNLSGVNDVVTTQAALKIKRLQANKHQVMAKALGNAMMTRYRLNIYWKGWNYENWDNKLKLFLQC